MVQTFDCVQCAACQRFQVQQRGATKKRWQCVACGEKQSYTRVFASGAAKEVRAVVQQLNYAHGTAMEEHAATYQPPAEEASWQYGAAASAGTWGAPGAWSHEQEQSVMATPSYGWTAPPAAHADHGGDVYVTEMPSRAPKPKRKYGDGVNEFKNDPRRMHDHQRDHASWVDAQEGSWHNPLRPPPRAFHAPGGGAAHGGGGAGDDSMYVTAGGSEVVEEEVWQG